MKYKRNKNSRPGVALLVVLFVIMAITILSSAFLSRSDVELACGENMALRTQMDYLAESGLDHAKGLILNPQDVSSEYWTGAAAQQLVTGSNDYYNVTVTRDDSVPTNRCNYLVRSAAYRLKGGQEVGRSNLTAELRLDPCIAFWTGPSRGILPPNVTINGDVYCADNLTNSGIINGDAFAKGSIVGLNIQGKINQNVLSPPVSYPALVVSNFSWKYYIGSKEYSVGIIIPGAYWNVSLGPTITNPAGIYYCNGNLDLHSNVSITGMLVVKDNLRMYGSGNAINAVKNFPALLVGNDITMENSPSNLTVTGLAQVGRRIDMKNKGSSFIKITGALYIGGDGIKNTTSCSVTVTAAPGKAAFEIWPASGVSVRWNPAAGAFFRSIKRE